MNIPIDVREIRIGQYADYLDTGIWTLKGGKLFAPETLTIGQLRDHLMLSGGVVYLDRDCKICWARAEVNDAV